MKTTACSRRSAWRAAGGFSLAADLPVAANRQLSLFTDGERDALDALRDLDLESLSPLDAFLWLARIKKQL